MQEENFVLLSAKVTAEKTVVGFTSRGDDQTTTDKKSKKRPHPDLVTEIAKLDAILNTVYGNSNMTATGLSVSVTDKGERITVTGKITFASGKQVGLSSESFGKDGYYEFEDSIWDIKKNIAAEVYAYIFQGKNADTQTSMDLGDTKQEAGSDPGPDDEPPEEREPDPNEEPM